MGGFSINSGTSALILAFIVFGFALRFITSPKDGARDLREFVSRHAIKSGMRSRVSRPLVLMGFAGFAGIIVWSIGLLFQVQIIQRIGIWLWGWVFFALLYMSALITGSIIAESLKPLRRKKTYPERIEAPRNDSVP